MKGLARVLWFMGSLLSRLRMTSDHEPALVPVQTGSLRYSRVKLCATTRQFMESLLSFCVRNGTMNLVLHTGCKPHAPAPSEGERVGVRCSGSSIRAPRAKLRFMDRICTSQMEGLQGTKIFAIPSEQFLRIIFQKIKLRAKASGFMGAEAADVRIAVEANIDTLK